jgi:hypothetical protein
MGMRAGIKAIVIAMAVMVLSGCFPGSGNKDPVLENAAFDIIGDQGIKTAVTLSELQGEYSGELWFEENEKSLYSSESYSCTGRIDGSVLTILWDMDGKSFGLGEGLEFELKDGIMMSDEEPEPRLICAVKVYPSGHMVDGLAAIAINDGSGSREVMVHFQLIR